LRSRIGQFVTARKRRHDLAHLQHTSVAELQPPDSRVASTASNPSAIAQRAPRLGFPGAPGAMYAARESDWAPRAGAWPVRWESHQPRAARWPVEPAPRFTTGSTTAIPHSSASGRREQPRDQSRRDRSAVRSAQPHAYDDIPPLAAAARD
jgi:hypothetical protein